MKRVRTLFINRFSLGGANDESKPSLLLDVLKSHPYTDLDGFGFKDVTLDEEVLTASYIRRTPSFIQEFDQASAEFVKRNVFLFSSIQFSVDLSMSFIVVEGGASQMNALRSAFRNILTIPYDIEPLNISPLAFYDQLKQRSINFDVKHITISSFNFDNSIIGRFSGEVRRQDILEQVLKTYTSEIAKMSFLINFESEEEFILQVFPNGSLKFLSTDDNSAYLTSYIKSLLFL